MTGSWVVGRFGSPIEHNRPVGLTLVGTGEQVLVASTAPLPSSSWMTGTELKSSVSVAKKKRKNGNRLMSHWNCGDTTDTCSLPLEIGTPAALSAHVTVP